MEDIVKVIESLSLMLVEVPEKLKPYSEASCSHKSAPEKWSKKEILGHLCDSCFNNLQRIIRVQYEDKPFIIYNQDEWVKQQNYQQRSMKDILKLWKSLHIQFIHALKTFPENKLDLIIDVGHEVTAHFVITDYLQHQRHHLNQIFEEK
jgi:hypothetical protein